MQVYMTKKTNLEKTKLAILESSLNVSVSLEVCNACLTLLLDFSNFHLSKDWLVSVVYGELNAKSSAKPS